MPRKSADHPDLRNLRLWIDRIATDYARLHVARSRGLMLRDYRDLELLRFALDGAASDSDDAVRRLIAAGVARYRQSVDIPSTPLPETLVLDFVVDAVWPLVVARELPRDWLGSVSAIASQPLALCVQQARTATTFGSPYSRQQFQQTIADRECVAGILHILRDLNDPRRGGSFLHVISETVMNDSPGQDSTTTPRLLRWILAGGAAGGSAAATGVIGNRTDDLVVDMWSWLMERIETAATVTAAGEAGGVSGIAAAGVVGATAEPVSDGLLGLIGDLWG